MNPANEPWREKIEIGFCLQPALQEELRFNMGKMKLLQLPAPRLRREVPEQGVLDIDGAGEMPLSKVRVIAIH